MNVKYNSRFQNVYRLWDTLYIMLETHDCMVASIVYLAGILPRSTNYSHLMAIEECIWDCNLANPNHFRHASIDARVVPSDGYFPRRGSRGGGVVTPPALDHQLCFQQTF